MGKTETLMATDAEEARLHRMRHIQIGVGIVVNVWRIPSLTGFGFSWFASNLHQYSATTNVSYAVPKCQYCVM